MKKKGTLVFGAIVSIVLLLVLGVLQTVDAQFLRLPIHWLAIAILPVLFALFTGGFITRFKGFGVELETTLKAPVGSLNLTASDAVADIPGDEKRSLSYLHGLSNDKKLATKWLLLRSGRENYYTAHGIEEYLRALPNIQYFEVRSESGDIICFIPISVFRDDTQQYNDNIKRDSLRRFITAIEDDNVTDSFLGSTITLKVKSEQGLVDVLKAMRAENVELAAVVSTRGRYLGVIFADEVERRIADTVLTASTA
jgi:hypothetical protein